MSDPPRFASCVCHLNDGRTIDLSGLTASEAFARLVAHGVTYDMVRETRTALVTREQLDAADELERLSVQ